MSELSFSTIDYKSMICDFLLNFKKGSKKIYHEKVNKLAKSEKKSLEVDFNDILKFNKDLANAFLVNPSEVLEIASSAIREIITSYLSSTEGKPIVKYYMRLKNLKPISLNKIRSKHIQKLVEVEGFVSYVGKIKSLLTIGTFICDRCGARNYVYQKNYEYTEPTSCVNPDCTNTTDFHLIESESYFVDYQEIRIKELEKNRPEGMAPVEMIVILIDDLVDKATLNDIVDVVGIVKSVPLIKSEIKKAIFDLYLDANNLTVIESFLR